MGNQSRVLQPMVSGFPSGFLNAYRYVYFRGIQAWKRGSGDLKAYRPIRHNGMGRTLGLWTKLTTLWSQIRSYDFSQIEASWPTWPKWSTLANMVWSYDKFHSKRGQSGEKPWIKTSSTLNCRNLRVCI